MKRRFSDTILILIALAIFLFGVVFGAIIQQKIIIYGAIQVAEGLEGTNIEINIDLNETELVKGFTKFLNETLISDNQTIGDEI